MAVAGGAADGPHVFKSNDAPLCTLRLIAAVLPRLFRCSNAMNYCVGVQPSLALFAGPC